MDIEGVPFTEPLSSFQWPVALPGTDPGDGPLFHVCFNVGWQPYILGCLLQLADPNTWSTDVEADLNLALERSGDLLYRFQVECPMIPPGTIVGYGGATAPDEWLLCDGSAVSRTTYADLFAVLGSTYGNGDGTTTFNLPDLRSSVPMGAGQGSGLSNRVLGDALGEETHTLSAGEVPSHSHTDTGHTHVEGKATPAVGAAIVGVPIPSAVPSVGVTGSGSANLTSSGGGGSHNNIQPSIVVTFLIKT